MYNDLKGEVGFDHYKGRSWPGWNHHMRLVLCASAVLVAVAMERRSTRSRNASRGRRDTSPLDPDAAIRIREGNDHVVAAWVPHLRMRTEQAHARHA